MCVLIVEDESLIRLIVAEEFSQAGFEVLEAEDGDQAAALIENPPTTFTLLITDIHIPGECDGIEVAPDAPAAPNSPGDLHDRPARCSRPNEA